VGLRVARVLCLVHTASVLVEGLHRARATALPVADPIEAGVRRASRARRWWRSGDPHYTQIAKLCLTYYRTRGWPITRNPTASDIGPLLADAEGRAVVDGSDRLVYDRFRTASRRTKRHLVFPMACADARAEFEAEQDRRPGADYAEIA
jgi:hypothetical protein